MNRCPVKTCGEPVPPDRYMCRGHWFKVPQHLRTAVWSAYNSYNAVVRSSKRTVEKVTAAGNKLRKAQLEALRAVHKQIFGTEEPT